MSNIDDLKNKIIRLRDQLRGAETSYNDALIAAHPVKIGQRFTHKRSGKVGEVFSVAVRYGESVSLLKMSKKDGSLGVQVWEMWLPEEWEETK